ncbi:MAG: hypothetical protein NTZ21_17525 [Actinobacteria bacterium]|nr:hypothetical protein [Actinomycetota bacterium]
MTIQPRTSRQRRAVRRVAGPRSRRLALVGAVVVLGLTACGSADDSGAGSASTLPAPAVIQIAGSASGAAPSAAGAADAAMSESKMMPMSLSYTWSGETPDLTTAAASWFFAPGVAPTAEQVEQLAAAFGVTGEAVELSADMGGGWTVGPNDGSAPSVTVAADAMQSWWFSPAWQTEGRGIVDDCALYPAGDPAADPSTAGQPVCEPAQPPAGIPTADEAEANARALLTSLGGDPAGYELETYADEWGASVTAFLVLDGVRTNLSFNVGYGEQGAITWAGGFLAAPQRGADYPRIGVDAAIERLNDQANAWMTGYGPAVRDAGVATEPAVMPAVEPAVGEDDAPATEPTEGVLGPDGAATSAGSAGAATAEAPTDTVLADPAVGDCTDPAVSCVAVDSVDLAPMVIDLNQVTSSLEQVWAADGTVWLLPGYAFTGADGMMANVLAVEDQYLEQAEPEVLPEPVPLPEPMPVETAVPGTDGVGEPAPVVDAAFDGSTLVGLTVDAASKLAEASGWTVRVAREDGVDLAVTMDYRDNRFNVAVEAGVVTEVVSIG